MLGTETLKFVKDLGYRLKLASGENSAYPFLLQRLSVAVQRGNAAYVMAEIIYILSLVMGSLDSAYKWRTFIV